VPNSPEGYVPERYPEIRARLSDRVRGAVGPSVDTTDGSLYGQLISLGALRLSRVYEKIERFSALRDADAAVDEILDTILAIAGVEPRDAVAAILAVGDHAPAVDTVIAAAEPGAAGNEITLSFDVGGEEGGHIVETGTDAVYFMDEGVSTVAGFEAAIATSTLFTILVPGTGATVLDGDDAFDPVALSGGRDADNDGRARLRLFDTVSYRGDSPSSYDRIYRALVSLDAVFDVRIRFPTTKTVEMIFLYDSTVTDWMHQVARVLKSRLIAGVQPVVDAASSSETGVAQDSAGNSHSYELGEIDQIDIDMDITVTTDSGLYPSNGDTLVAQAALPREPDAFVVTEDVVHLTRTGRPALISEIECRVLEVPGVVDASVLIARSGQTPFNVDVSLQEFEAARYDVANFTVNS
jgi:hypothetical protein